MMRVLVRFTPRALPAADAGGVPPRAGAGIIGKLKVGMNAPSPVGRPPATRTGRPKPAATPYGPGKGGER